MQSCSTSISQKYTQHNSIIPLLATCPLSILYWKLYEIHYLVKWPIYPFCLAVTWIVKHPDKIYIFQYNTGKMSGTSDKYQFNFKLAETVYNNVAERGLINSPADWKAAINVQHFYGASLGILWTTNTKFTIIACTEATSSYWMQDNPVLRQIHSKLLSKSLFSRRSCVRSKLLLTSWLSKQRTRCTS